MRIEDILPVAMGKEPADLLVKNARVVNVFSGEIEKTNIAIYRKRIAGLGDYTEGKRVIDLKGAYVVPGLIDAHLHVESSMVDPVEFARAVLTRGTTTIIADPHEIANVMGLKGVEYMINYTEGIPLNVYVMMPSSVPATDKETSGAQLRVADMIGFLEKHPRVLGLGEVMNYPGVLNASSELITMIELFRHKYKKIDGHAPGLSGKDLNAYICAFIRSDHESTTPDEALEKVSRGMQVLIREGSVARNMDDLIGIVTPMNHYFFSFCTDDKHPGDILDEGHIDHMIRKAVKAGIDPVVAIRMATINTARHYGLRSMGAVAPGYKADFVVTESLKDFWPKLVVKDARVVAQDGKLMVEISGRKDSIPDLSSTFVCDPLKVEELRLKRKEGKIRVIEVSEKDVLTYQLITEPKVEDGLIVSDTSRDILKVSVISRYTKRSMTTGFVKGFGLKRGALATSVGHDSHNLCVVGENDLDMVVAANRVMEMGGGMVVANDGKVVGELPLDVAGLMSSLGMEEVANKINLLKRISHDLGATLHDPFMTLSFVQLAVIPELRITDRGLVDVERGEFVDLFV
ncbi:MAG: adenine deaminase [Thermotogota bacterium]|nr:adenine deaminase [Thermotogota bacterium]